jgi:hypothetical protein
LGRDAVSWDLKDLEREINGVGDMTFQIVEQGSPHIDDPDRGVVCVSPKLSGFDESGMVSILKRKRFGIEEGWKEEEKEEEKEEKYLHEP